jgi:hypothetical protein
VYGSGLEGSTVAKFTDYSVSLHEEFIFRCVESANRCEKSTGDGLRFSFQHPTPSSALAAWLLPDDDCLPPFPPGFGFGVVRGLDRCRVYGLQVVV